MALSCCAVLLVAPHAFPYIFLDFEIEGSTHRNAWSLHPIACQVWRPWMEKGKCGLPPHSNPYTIFILKGVIRRLLKYLHEINAGFWFSPWSNSPWSDDAHFPWFWEEVKGLPTKELNPELLGQKVTRLPYTGASVQHSSPPSCGRLSAIIACVTKRIHHEERYIFLLSLYLFNVIVMKI